MKNVEFVDEVKVQQGVKILIPSAVNGKMHILWRVQGSLIADC